MKIQKFFRGHKVRVAKDLGSSMSHFQGDCNAIVIGSYNDQYGGGHRGKNTPYSLLLFPKGSSPYSCSWYMESQLTLMDQDRDIGEATLQKYGDK